MTPPETLGDVKRLYERAPEDIRDLLLNDTTTSVWLVERLRIGRTYVAGFAFDAEIADHYEMTEWFFQGDLTLVRFDPIGAERPAPVPCDTVPNPDEA